jgi:hypothetical protein
MHPAYFQTRFRSSIAIGDLPECFAILTAHATTGESWSLEQNTKANEALRTVLQERSALLGEISGHAPQGAHEEPGFAAALSFDEACDLGRLFKQDAIYFVQGGTLFVSHCDGRRGMQPIAQFAARVDARAFAPNQP